MDAALIQLIRQTLDAARRDGRDFMTQAEVAVWAVREAYPDVTAPDALVAVNLVRRS